MRDITAAILLICTLLAGCATLPAEAPIPTATLVPTGTIPSKSELNSRAAVVYQRSGGIAGLDEKWTISPDGSVAYAPHAQGEGPERLYQVDAAEVTALLDKLESLGFFTLSGNYMPLDTCCDRITYTIEAYRTSQANHVVTLDGAPDTPPELWQAIDALNAFVGQF